MAKTVLNPSSARKNFYKLLKDVNENHTEIEIISERSENNAVLIGLDDWKAIKGSIIADTEHQKNNLYFVEVNWLS
ncbi:type II toxin-antitoxin system Phd/YefM family antitoxin [Listeria innocua]